MDVDGQHCLGVLNEEEGYDVSEDGEHDPGEEDHEGQKYQAGSPGKHRGGQITYGAPLVFRRDHQAPVIVHGPDEDRSQDDPEEGRQPAPDDCDGGTHDRGCSGNRREMVAEEDMTRGWNEIHAVFEFMGWGDERTLFREHFPCQKNRVKTERRGEGNEAEKCDDRRIHASIIASKLALVGAAANAESAWAMSEAGDAEGRISRAYGNRSPRGRVERKMLQSGNTLTLSRGGLIMGTRAGVLQYSAVPETIKDTMLLESGVPALYLVPQSLFSAERGISLAELEFPAYYNFFIKSRPIRVICRESQRNSLVRVLSRSLFGPEELNEAEFGLNSRLTREGMQSELAFFRRNPLARGDRLMLEDLVKISTFDARGEVCLSDESRLVLESDESVSLVEGGRIQGTIPSRPPLPPMILESDESVLSFHRPVLGVSVIGSGHGFDAGNRTSGFIMWIDGQGVMVDPPVDSTEWLKGYDVPPKQVDKLILTHCHADHDAGTLQKILQEGRVSLYTTPTIVDNFVSKYAPLTGMTSANFRALFDFVPVHAHESIFLNGAEVMFRYSFHSIPCIGFEIFKGGKSIIYPSDTLNHPPTILDLHEKGIFTTERRDELVNFPWNHSLVLHEAGIPPIHTPVEYLDDLPQEVKERMFLVHVSSKQLVKTTELRVAPTGLENTIDLKASRDQIQDPVELLETLSRVEIFSELPLTRAPEFLRMIRREHFKVGERILSEGELGARFYIIIKGRAAIVRKGKELKIYSEYDYFGETAIILKTPRNADVVAKTDVSVLSIDHGDFLHLIRGTDLPVHLTRLAKARAMKTWKFLVNCQNFGNPTTNQLTQIQSLMEPLQLKRGDRFTGQIMLLSKGTITVQVGKQAIAKLGSGFVVGDVRALVSKRRSHFTFSAQGAVEGWSFKLTGFRKFLYKNPGIFMLLRALLPPVTKTTASRAASGPRKQTAKPRKRRPLESAGRPCESMSKKSPLISGSDQNKSTGRSRPGVQLKNRKSSAKKVPGHFRKPQ